jgi:nucleotide-binding universal stress UspA family protein
VSATLMLGVDQDTESQVVGEAGALAVDFDARIVITHVVELAPSLCSPAEWELECDSALRRARENLYWVPGELPSGLDVRERVELGRPAAALAQIALDENVDLLVIGARGRAPLTSAPMGDVARTLVGSAPCPVLTIGGTQRDAASREADRNGRWRLTG